MIYAIDTYMYCHTELGKKFQVLPTEDSVVIFLVSNVVVCIWFVEALVG